MENNSPIVLGRPVTPESEVVLKKKTMLDKIEPYLKSGLSIRKSCLEADINRSELYVFIAEDDNFSDQIHKFQQYMSVITSNTIVREMIQIAQKQNPKVDKDGNVTTPAKPLTQSDLDLVKWFALNSKSAKEEFGERKDINTFDPEAELKRLNEAIEASAKPEEPIMVEDDINKNETEE